MVEFEEEDFVVVSDTLNEKELKQQILQDHEDAKKHNDLMNANSEIVQHNIDITKDRQIVKRLEEEIKDIENSYHEDWRREEIVDALQKILEGKK